MTRVMHEANPDFDFFVLFLFEYGLLLNDDINLKMSMLSSPAAADTKLRTKLYNDIRKLIAPDVEDIDSSIDARMPSLMKELENTIVTFDRASMQRVRAEIKKEKMQI